MGASLTSDVSKLFEEFTEKFKEFVQNDYDCLDLESVKFKQELEDICAKFEDYQQRLGSVFCQALSGCPTAQHISKVTTLFCSVQYAFMYIFKINTEKNGRY